MADLFRRFARPLFWSTLAFAYAAAIMPAPEAPDLGAGDKVNHIAAFLVLTWLGRNAYRALGIWRLALGLSAFGVLIELTQAIPFLHRDASVWDWAADSAAIAVALAVMLPFEKHRAGGAD